MTTTHETKAARMMALYRLTVEGRLSGISDSDIAAAFGTRRETIWKDRQAMKRADAIYQAFVANPPQPRGYTTGQAARLLGVTRFNVHAYRRAGKLIATQDENGHWRIAASEIERLQRDGVERKRPGPKPIVKGENNGALQAKNHRPEERNRDAHYALEKRVR